MTVGPAVSVPPSVCSRNLSCRAGSLLGLSSTLRSRERLRIVVSTIASGNIVLVVGSSAIWTGCCRIPRILARTSARRSLRTTCFSICPRISASVGRLAITPGCVVLGVRRPPIRTSRRRIPRILARAPVHCRIPVIRLSIGGCHSPVCGPIARRGGACRFSNLVALTIRIGRCGLSKCSLSKERQQEHSPDFE